MGPFNPRVRSSATERQVKNWLNFVSSGTGGGAPMKTIQTGTITIGSGSQTGTATISTVTTTNCLLLYGGYNTNSSLDPDGATLVLTNGTTVTADKGNASTDTLNIVFTVLEFNSGIIKSNGSGLITIVNGTISGTVTIPAVVVAKTVVVYTGNQDSAADLPNVQLVRVNLTNTTTITANNASNPSPNTVKVGYSYIEFL